MLISLMLFAGNVRLITLRLFLLFYDGKEITVNKSRFLDKYVSWLIFYTKLIF